MNDLERLRREYAERERRLASSNIYSLFNRANLFITQQRQRDTLDLLRSRMVNTLRGRRILEIGCGRGAILLEFLMYGAEPLNLFGCDLLPDRVLDAHRMLPHLPLSCADGQHLPYKSSAFDLILQYTVFSSILDDTIKHRIANEMLRVLKPDGMILWYDFWLNPTNPQTRGIRPIEIRALFPGCQIEHHRITLAPPITRFVVPWGWPLCLLLEKTRMLNSHYLAAIHPVGST